jgi:hypothetical protein
VLDVGYALVSRFHNQRVLPEASFDVYVALDLENVSEPTFKEENVVSEFEMPVPLRRSNMKPEALMFQLIAVMVRVVPPRSMYVLVVREPYALSTKFAKP